MAKLCLKKQSKRVPARRRYKIEKKVREHNRKLRREARKKNKNGQRKTVIRVPNLCPFKEDILKDVENLRKKKEEEKQQAKLAYREQKLKEKQQNGGQKSLESVIHNAEKDQKLYDGSGKSELEDDSKNFNNRGERNSGYYKEYKKVVEASDIILEVIDARDPLGTRSKEVEEHVLGSVGKRLVFVLNKSDLIPRENLSEWLKYLRQFFPTVPFKASTQQQVKKLGWRKLKKKTPASALSVSSCVGAELLMSVLANYCRNKNIKTCITVGIVGLPNVGKSSVINSLKRSRACHVGAVPGITRNIQEVQLDSKIKLLDSPGIVFTNTNLDTNAAALKNAVRTENLKDPMSPATSILQRVDKKQMMEIYDLTEYSSPNEFFTQLAKRFGRFKKGGIPDRNMAARIVIDDWNRGKIKYYSVPPEEPTDIHVSAEIVQTMSKEFDVNEFEAMETSVINSLVELESSSVAATESENTEKMDTEEPSQLLQAKIKVAKTKKRGRKNAIKEKKVDPQSLLEGNQKLNALNKLKVKKLKKEKARKARAEQLSSGNQAQ